jgi:hypothetical protein
MQPPPFSNGYGMIIDSLYSLVAILSCLIIYAKTRDLYDLTYHRGVGYFRKTFLFFGSALLIRFFFHALAGSSGGGHIGPAFGMFELVFSMSIYLNCVALIYLILSIFWKRIDRSLLDREYLVHVLSMMITLLGMIRIIPLMFVMFQMVLLFILLYVVFSSWKEQKKLNGLHLIYLLMFGLMILSNVLEFLSFFTPLISLMIYSASIPLFVLLLLKVLSDLNSKK